MCVIVLIFCISMIVQIKMIFLQIVAIFSYAYFFICIPSMANMVELYVFNTFLFLFCHNATVEYFHIKLKFYFIFCFRTELGNMNSLHSIFCFYSRFFYLENVGILDYFQGTIVGGVNFILMKRFNLLVLLTFIMH